MTVLMPGIRTVIIHNITSPKFKAPVSSKSNHAARWGARIGYHVIGVIKLKFGFTKVRYRGLEKNANRLFATCGLANLYIVRHRFRAA